jgi:hypothetical protein
MSSPTSSGWADPPRAGAGTGHDYYGRHGHGPNPAPAAPGRPLGALEGE